MDFFKRIALLLLFCPQVSCLIGVRVTFSIAVNFYALFTFLFV